MGLKLLSVVDINQRTTPPCPYSAPNPSVGKEGEQQRSSVIIEFFAAGPLLWPQV